LKSNKLTNKQDAILIFIKKYIAKNDYPPTVREIAKAVNLSSPATVHVHLKNLIQKGYIKRNDNNHRMLELLVPNEFEASIDDKVSIKLVRNNKKNSTLNVLKSSIDKYDEVVAFKMDNDNLKDFGILVGDILVFEIDNVFFSDDIVLFRKNNVLFVDKFLNQDNIIGRLIKLYRDY